MSFPAGGLEPKVRFFSFSPTLKVGDVVWVGNDEQGVECLITGREGDKITVERIPRRPPHADE